MNLVPSILFYGYVMYGKAAISKKKMTGNKIYSRHL